MRVIFLFFCFMAPCFSQISGNDPILNKRCKELLAERDRKLRIKQRYDVLFSRAGQLREKVPENKKSSQAQVDVTKMKIQREREKKEEEVAKLKETLIRRGCPLAKI